jgi:hypothetical protein
VVKEPPGHPVRRLVFTIKREPLLFSVALPTAISRTSGGYVDRGLLIESAMMSWEDVILQPLPAVGQIYLD